MSAEARAAGNRRARVRGVLTEVLGRPLQASDDGIPLRDLLGVRYDSMTVLECVAAIETEFDIGIDLLADDLSHTFRSVEAVDALVARKLADREALTGRARVRDA